VSSRWQYQWHRQAKRVRTRDDQYRHDPLDGECPGAPSAIHTMSVTTAGTDGNQREQERRTVGNALRARSRGLRLFDEPHDIGEGGAFARSRDLYAQ
jgi:hypothetical protein